MRPVQPHKEPRIVRRRKRISLIRPCRYEMSEPPDGERITFHRGYAISGNVSSTGMLLILPHTPRSQQILEVDVPSPTSRKGPRLTLVEVRWTREIDVDPGAHMCLAGVKFLFSPSPLSTEALLELAPLKFKPRQENGDAGKVSRQLKRAESRHV